MLRSTGQGRGKSPLSRSQHSGGGAAIPWVATLPWAIFSPVARTVKNLSALQETQVQSLGQGDTLKETATHSSILAWRIMDR